MDVSQRMQSTDMNRLLLVIFVLLTGCDDGVLNPVTINNIIKEQKLYKESVLNQRSGISFTWGYSESYHPILSDRPTGKGFYGGGQAYHDINNDGFQDILVSFHSDVYTANLRWYINNGDNKHFTSAGQQYFNKSTNGISAHKILKTDVNNDGIADFIVLGVDERIQNDYTGNFTVLIGTKGGAYIVNNIPNPNRYWFHNGAAGDINGDGNVDVITAMFIWYGDGKGNFVKTNEYNLEKYTPLVYEILDMDKDGWNDLILRGPFKETTIIYNNNGTFNESNKTYTLPPTTYKSVMDIEIVDFDKDGDLDILELAQLGGNSDDPKNFVSKITVYYNNNLDFHADETVIGESLDGNTMNGESDKYGWSTFKIDDIDKDGVDEIVAENYHDGNYSGLKLVGGNWKRIIFN